ncbi:MAG: BACON domain-containing protein [Bifidobacteriaceae bacterium]|nr:BACON domain-containing protein [Bifidobacteriaceae bacterium]
MTGVQSFSLPITAQPNTGAARSGSITIRAGSATRTIGITQTAAPAPTLTVEVYSPPRWIAAANAWNPAPAAGGTLSLRITTNQPTWSVTSDRDWSTVSTNSGASGETFTWTAARNTGAARSGSITIRAGSATRTIGITQTRG